MFPHIHLIFGLILVNVFANYSINSLEGIFLLVGSIIPDADIFFIRKISKSDNHRNLFTHYPIFYLVLTIIFLSLHSSISYLFFAALLHTLIDVIDFDIMIFAPINKKKYSVLKLDFSKIGQGKKYTMFLKNYYTQTYVLLVEVMFVFLLIFSIFLGSIVNI